MSLNVKLEVFEGPLDLLLHLIDKNKVDIYDIPIVLITEQYMDYLEKLEEALAASEEGRTNRMNIMSEFLVMAATLLDIKCKMLLPKEVNEEGEEEDPRAELVERLIEYKLCKYMCYELKDRQIDAVKTLFKKPTIPSEVAKYEPPVNYEELLGDTDLYRLNQIFKAIMRRQTDRIDPIRSKFGKIEKDEINLEEKTAEIREYVKLHKRCSFMELLSEQRTRMDVVVTFLVILELMKTGDIRIEQDDLFEDIIINSLLAAA
ncbi:MAG: segregation/condensation protein A [Lachnospiraceae bacterium]|nr:segregation/condensation protein A [Lachnospiraceae bacterium]